jgi:hypothetical protein
MATITVERLRRDGPFHVGDRYEVAAPDADEHLSGTIIAVVPTGPKHVNVTVEVDDESGPGGG